MATLSPKEQCDILMKEYLALRSEIRENSRYYKAHIKTFAVVLTIIVAVFSLGEKFGIVWLQSRLIWLLLGFSIPTIVSFIAFDAMETHYAVIAIAARVGCLEEQINKKAETHLLMWETLSDEFWPARSPLRGVPHPSRYFAAYGFIALCVALFSIPGYLIYHFWANVDYKDYVCTIRTLIVICSAYSLGCLGLIIYVARGAIRMRKEARPFVRDLMREAEQRFDQLRRQS